jgi:6-phosphofructokinase 1
MFVIGGDGGMRAATFLSEAIKARGLDIAVIGVPKTIDNDLPFTDQSFGFQSAFARATDFVSSVSVEAAASPNGVGIVKLMGRHSGFIASYAALAANGADIVLIPEIRPARPVSGSRPSMVPRTFTSPRVPKYSAEPGMTT